MHRGISLSESAANLTAILLRLHAIDPRVRPYLMTMSPAIGLRGLLRWRLARYYDLYPRLAANLRTGFIDNRPDWQALPHAILQRAIPDGTHPRPEFAVKITLANVLTVLARDFATPQS
jgi:hypothetical protein